MTFQFLCPQGHLLEGDPSQMGQPCTCPMCGMQFIIPVAQTAPHAAEYNVAPGYNAPAGDPFAPAEPAPFESPDPLGGASADVPDFDGESSGPKIYHIPCPNGHELETPEEMLDQEVLCPFCGEQFQLRQKDSVEYKRKREAEQERRDRQIGEKWFKYAIAMAVFVVLGLVVLIVLSHST